MSELEKLPNIGKTLADKLIEVGINTSDDLYNTGSERAFIKLNTIDNSVCINTLYALEGAVQGIRWHGLDKLTKKELLEFYDFVKFGNE